MRENHFSFLIQIDEPQWIVNFENNTVFSFYSLIEFGNIEKKKKITYSMRRDEM